MFERKSINVVLAKWNTKHTSLSMTHTTEQLLTSDENSFDG